MWQARLELHCSQLDDKPTYAIVCNEIDGTKADAAAIVQSVCVLDGEVKDMIKGMVAGMGGCVVAERVGQSRCTVGRVCDRYREQGLEALHDAPRSGRPRVFSAVERAQIENLACSDPAESGLEQIRWSVRALATAAEEQEIVDSIDFTSVALLLRQATLKPHRSRYWKSTVWNATAVECASKVLWCYEQVEWLKERGEIVMCLDESPNQHHAPQWTHVG